MPAHETTKVVGWRPRAGLDVAVNRDVRSTGRAWPVGVWVPTTREAHDCACDKVEYAADRPRSSNLRQMTNLAHGREAMLFKVRTPEELGAVIHVIEAARLRG